MDAEQGAAAAAAAGATATATATDASSSPAATATLPASWRAGGLGLQLPATTGRTAALNDGEGSSSAGGAGTGGPSSPRYAKGAGRYNLGPVVVFVLAFLVMEWGTMALSATAIATATGAASSASSFATVTSATPGARVGAWDLGVGGIPLVRR